VREGEMEDTPEPAVTRLPPVAASYHSIVQPLAGIALKVTVPLPQRLLSDAPVGGAGVSYTVPVTAARCVDKHPVVG
jgi:hypothetical protein